MNDRQKISNIRIMEKIYSKSIGDVAREMETDPKRGLKKDEIKKFTANLSGMLPVRWRQIPNVV